MYGSWIIKLKRCRNSCFLGFDIKNVSRNDHKLFNYAFWIVFCCDPFLL